MGFKPVIELMILASKELSMIDIADMPLDIRLSCESVGATSLMMITVRNNNNSVMLRPETIWFARSEQDRNFWGNCAFFHHHHYNFTPPQDVWHAFLIMLEPLSAWWISDYCFHWKNNIIFPTTTTCIHFFLHSCWSNVNWEAGCNFRNVKEGSLPDLFNHQLSLIAIGVLLSQRVRELQNWILVCMLLLLPAEARASGPEIPESFDEKSVSAVDLGRIGTAWQFMLSSTQ